MAAAAGIDSGTLALWATVVALGALHGLNPSMGWPLAVANGLSARRGAAVFGTFAPLGAGHLLAMAVVLLPLALAGGLLAWSRELRTAAGLLVLGAGLWRLAGRATGRRHPRWMARVRPTQLALWSFLVASAHGAGLMLLPVAMGLCSSGPAPGGTLGTDLGATLGTALGVAALHTAAMLASGLGCAWLVYRFVGLGALRRGWVDGEAAWALCLVAGGAASLWMAWRG